jgi:hypothetical protein
VKRTLIVTAALATAALLSGCATPDPGYTPITTLDAAKCPATKPDFSKAIPLFVHKSDTKTTLTKVDDKAPCFTDARGASTYAVFAIPPLAGQYTIEVDATPYGSALFAPRIMLFDKDGNLTRTVMEKQITYRGSSLSAVFRNHDGEAYLVAASDPAATGQKDSRIAGNTTATMICTGYGCFTTYSGAETTMNVTFSHNGKVSVTLIPIPPPK